MAKAKLSKKAAAPPKRIKEVRETPEGFDGRSLASRRDTQESAAAHDPKHPSDLGTLLEFV